MTASAASWLVDTNVVSELRKGRRCDRGVARWAETVEEDSLWLSVLVIGEIRRGVEAVRRRDPRSAVTLELWLAELTEQHADRILPVDRTIAEEWGRLSVPDPLPVVDGLLAATAKVHRLTLVTRNVRDLERTGVPLINPFTR